MAVSAMDIMEACTWIGASTSSVVIACETLFELSGEVRDGGVTRCKGVG